jgi:copper chaperone CopZ
MAESKNQKTMKRMYKISGMTCNGCVAIVHDLLLKVPGITEVNVNLDRASAEVVMEGKVTTEQLNAALAGSIYALADDQSNKGKHINQDESVTSKQKNKKLVTDYIAAVGKMDYRALDFCLHPHFEFKGLIHLHGADAYINMIREHVESGVSSFLLKNEIRAIFMEAGEAYVIYDALTSTTVKRIPFFEKISIKDERILSTEVKFDTDLMKQLTQQVHKLKSAKRTNGAEQH